MNVRKKSLRNREKQERGHRAKIELFKDFIDSKTSYKFDILPDMWSEADERFSQKLLEELELEVTHGHPLYLAMFNKNVEIVAHMGRNCDDILCRLTDNPEEYIIVHLTWKGGTECDKEYPTIDFRGSFESFFLNQVDHLLLLGKSVSTESLEYCKNLNDKGFIN